MQLLQLPKPKDVAYIDYSMMVDQLQEEIQQREAEIEQSRKERSERYWDDDDDIISDEVMEDREEVLQKQLEQLQMEKQSKLKTRSQVF